MNFHAKNKTTHKNASQGMEVAGGHAQGKEMYAIKKHISSLNYAMMILGAWCIHSSAINVHFLEIPFPAVKVM